jgi:hypothetical protein
LLSRDSREAQRVILNSDAHITPPTMAEEFPIPLPCMLLHLTWQQVQPTRLQEQARAAPSRAAPPPGKDALPPPPSAAAMMSPACQRPPRRARPASR